MRDDEMLEDTGNGPAKDPAIERRRQLIRRLAAAALVPAVIATIAGHSRPARARP
jgi:hypothetical protein